MGPQAKALTRLVLAICAAALATHAQSDPARDERPNVLWIFVEDLEDWFGCYGHDVVPTPHVDALAARGTRFTRAYMPAGVCSATRSALITGAMQTSLGVHNHRSARANFRGKTMGPRYDAIRLPDGVRTIPELLRSAGYYTFNQGKTDYNFEHDPSALYDRNHGQMNFRRIDLGRLWRPAVRGRKPFFGQIQLRGGKNRPGEARADRDAVTIPPYYPDVELVREEYGHHYDCVAETDAEVGAILAALESDGLLANTVVYFFSDHGFRMHRHKQFLYEGGIRVPLVVAGPNVPRDATRDDLVSGIDISASTLRIAGVDVPAHVEGRALFGDDRTPREFVVAARDRCDYTIERIRAIVTPRYKYLRNYLTDRPYMQPQYRDPWPVTVELRRMVAAGELDPTQLAFFGDTKPAEELYDLAADPHETRNLAADPAHANVVARHRAVLADWIERSGDRGQHTESEAGLRAALRRWGDACVNPEYDAPRRAIAAENAAKYRVLILGDSISMGYTKTVTDTLWDEAVVVRPAENCQGTTHGVARIDDWLAIDGGDFDVITFNFGLHDLKRVHPETRRNSNDPDHPNQADLETYERQLREIVGRLARTDARLMCVTTTPVPSGGVRPHRDPADVARYNEIARRVAAEHDAAIIDLHGFAAAHDGLQRARDVHFTPMGSRELGRHVAENIRAAGPEKR